MNRVRTYLAIACVAAICLVDTSLIWAQGLMIPMHGPINRSMGGAATAAPVATPGAGKTTFALVAARRAFAGRAPAAGVR